MFYYINLSQFACCNNQNISHLAYYIEKDMACIALDNRLLTLKAASKICSRRYSKIFIFFYFSGKTSLDISCELSAWQMIEMKYQDLFSSE